MAELVVIDTNQYLTFTLGEEKYAIDVSKVKEVLELVSITRVPKTPEFMKGVINLRGSVVPVIDLRLKFDLDELEDTVDTCIIVLEIKLEDETIVIGAVADSVQEVIELTPENIEPAPKIGTRLNTDFLNGMGKYNDKFLMVLNIDKVFTSEDLSVLQEGQKTMKGSEEKDD